MGTLLFAERKGVLIADAPISSRVSSAGRFPEMEQGVRPTS